MLNITLTIIILFFTIFSLIVTLKSYKLKKENKGMDAEIKKDLEDVNKPNEDFTGDHVYHTTNL